MKFVDDDDDDDDDEKYSHSLTNVMCMSVCKVLELQSGKLPTGMNNDMVGSGVGLPNNYNELQQRNKQLEVSCRNSCRCAI